jgi:hypothetical protein
MMRTVAVGIGVAGLAGLARPAEIFVNANIAVSTTWTADNTYNLQQQIFVLPGATLTIEAGTIVASTTNIGGSLAVTRGAQIFVQGTQENPVIMTSKADVMTWIGGDPKTGTWRAASNEWGNLTLLGNGYISEDATPGNVPTPNPNNVATMEGLVAAFPGDPTVLYGGGNDDDDSGSISFLSIRYGGKVVGLNVELNGLALGGIGRETDIHHFECMNNVDDGLEIWGGTVNVKYVSVWNVGDDSIDVDQGWRGKIQFALIVQGYSTPVAQGSGVGDNAFELDGAENSHWQPVTTSTFYNCTVIGQPISGDRLTAWRDNARIQFRNCIFMDGGEHVVGFDNIDGDGGNGYGFQGTLSWPDTWTTDYTQTSPVNAPPNPGAFYTVQTSGKLAEIKDSVFFNNTHAAAYTEAIARGVFAPANNNVQEPASSPITGITRGAPVVVPAGAMLPVTFLDPRPANDALTSVAWAPNDGFFSSAHYRGAFAPGNNWLCPWTASYAYGFTPGDAWCDLGSSLAGTYGDPVLAGTGTLAGGQPVSLTLMNAKENSPGVWVSGASRLDLPAFGGVVVPNFLAGGLLVPVTTDGAGNVTINGTWPMGIPSGFTFYNQFWIFDVAAPQLFAASNAIVGTTP